MAEDSQVPKSEGPGKPGLPRKSLGFPSWSIRFPPDDSQHFSKRLTYVSLWERNVLDSGQIRELFNTLFEEHNRS